MDKKTEKHILNVLRQGTLAWPARNNCLKRGRRFKCVGKFKNGKDKNIYERQCDECGKWCELRDGELEVDHIDPVGSFTGNFDEYIRRMYCDESNLQALCISCHHRKSAVENAARRLVRKDAAFIEEIENEYF